MHLHYKLLAKMTANGSDMGEGQKGGPKDDDGSEDEGPKDDGKGRQR